MLLKWRQHHFVRFLALTGNHFPVPLGLLQVLEQTEILTTYNAAMDEVARKFLAGDSHYHHSLSPGKNQSSPATVLRHAYKYSVSTLKKLHSPYGKLSTRQIQER